jgi:hypothetical protein
MEQSMIARSFGALVVALSCISTQLYATTWYYEGLVNAVDQNGTVVKLDMLYSREFLPEANRIVDRWDYREGNATVSNVYAFDFGNSIVVLKSAGGDVVGQAPFTCVRENKKIFNSLMSCAYTLETMDYSQSNNDTYVEDKTLTFNTELGFRKLGRNLYVKGTLNKVDDEAYKQKLKKMTRKSSTAETPKLGVMPR